MDIESTSNVGPGFAPRIKPRQRVTLRWKVGFHLGRLRHGQYLEEERHSNAPLRTRLRAWRRGFLSSSYLFYDLDNNDPKHYLSDAAVFMQRSIEGRYCRILRDKAIFGAYVGLHVRVPRTVAIIARGSVCAAIESPALSDVASLIAYCEGSAGVILKPAHGQQGRSVSSMKVGAAGVLLNDRPVERADLERYIRGLDDFVVTDIVAQGRYAADIFPGSANTIRIVTMPDPGNGHRPFVAGALHRFGTSASAPVDNVSRGGVAAGIDIESGRMGPATGYYDRTPLPAHPETGRQIEGVTVPGWQEVLREILELAEALDFLTFVGWDVLATDDGVVVIEGNNGPDRVLSQRFHPFLVDPRARRFFEYCGVL